MARSTEAEIVFPDELWTRVVFDYACAYRRRPLYRGPLVGSLTPLYLARVASLVTEWRELVSEQVEDRIESLCKTFEAMKPYLLSQWDGQKMAAEEPHAIPLEVVGQ